MASPRRDGRSTLDESRVGLTKHGHLAEEDGRLVFVKDYAFKTPSAAANVVIGSSANGWTEWKLEDGRPLKVYQST